MTGTAQRWLGAAVFAFLSPIAHAQADIQISGTFAFHDSNGGVDGTFECVGAPVCQGTYRVNLRNQGCSNLFTLRDSFTMTGLTLSQPGPLQGTVTVRNGNFSDQQHANGTCSIRPGTFRDLLLRWDGHWDGQIGRFTLRFDDGGDDVPGIFKAELPPVFKMQVRSQIDANTATAVADFQPRPQDAGTTQSVFVFAMAPESRVRGANNPDVLKLGKAKDERKAETPIGCVLAQLNAAGQMVAVSSANLAAYLTGVLSAQGASVNILNGVPTGNVAGATFFLGYGSSSTSMINSGVNRAAVTVPGSLVCEPAAPQTGWWWNPAEDGRGFSIEKRGNNLFFASFLYHSSGRSTWLVSSGPVSLEGTLYNGDLLSAGGGQTLGGPYIRFPTLRSEGPMTMTFNNASTGTLVWPGGTVPIQRFNIIPNGLNLPAVPGQPQSGWWWNEQEAGRGFFLEFQNGWLDIAGYMYDDDGNPVWYLNVGQLAGTEGARTLSGSWWSYGNGMTLGGPWRQHARTNANVAPLTITFTGPETAVMTLPNNRTTNLTRHRF